MRPRHLAGAALAAAAAVLSLAITAGPSSAAGGVGAAPSAPDDEQALAERFAPVVRLVHQDVECGPGEPYRPSDVETVLGDRSVALRGPWEGDEIVRVGPTADQLGEGLSGYYLDFPGNPLDAGCDYERWSRAAAADSAPTTYAHVVTEDGHDDRVVLQYWFFYPFNDYTNKHEGDWEVIQLVFAAPDATEALDQTPIEVGYSQHEGAEVSSWDDPKLEIVEGTHPVVYPPPARTRTSTSRRSTSARRPSRGSAATTPAARATTYVPPSPSSPPIRRPRSRTSPGSPTRGGGASAKRRSTTDRQAPTPRPAGPTRSPTWHRRAATSATPSPPAGSWAPPPRTSSAAPCRAARRSSASWRTVPSGCS